MVRVQTSFVSQLIDNTFLRTIIQIDEGHIPSATFATPCRILSMVEGAGLAGLVLAMQTTFSAI